MSKIDSNLKNIVIIIVLLCVLYLLYKFIRRNKKEGLTSIGNPPYLSSSEEKCSVSCNKKGFSVYDYNNGWCKCPDPASLALSGPVENVVDDHGYTIVEPFKEGADNTLTITSSDPSVGNVNLSATAVASSPWEACIAGSIETPMSSLGYCFKNGHNTRGLYDEFARYACLGDLTHSVVKDILEWTIPAGLANSDSYNFYSEALPTYESAIFNMYTDHKKKIDEYQQTPADPSFAKLPDDKLFASLIVDKWLNPAKDGPNLLLQYLSRNNCNTGYIQPVPSSSTTDGYTVVQGPKGTSGTAGQMGQDGNPGQDGIDGDDGSAGQDGNPGATGIDGTTGTDGQIGQDGNPGTTGIDGKDGSTGTDGAAGQDGNPGDDGGDGSSIVGPQGPQGPPGATTTVQGEAVQGPPGPAGPPGQTLKPSGMDINLSTGEGTVTISGEGFNNFSPFANVNQHEAFGNYFSVREGVDNTYTFPVTVEGGATETVSQSSFFIDSSGHLQSCVGPNDTSCVDLGRVKGSGIVDITTDSSDNMIITTDEAATTSGFMNMNMGFSLRNIVRSVFNPFHTMREGNKEYTLGLPSGAKGADGDAGVSLVPTLDLSNGILSALWPGSLCSVDPTNSACSSENLGEGTVKIEPCEPEKSCGLSYTSAKGISAFSITFSLDPSFTDAPATVLSTEQNLTITFTKSGNTITGTSSSLIPATTSIQTLLFIANGAISNKINFKIDSVQFRDSLGNKITMTCSPASIYDPEAGCGTNFTSGFTNYSESFVNSNGQLMTHRKEGFKEGAFGNTVTQVLGNIMGAQGPQGEQGPQGPQGTAGLSWKCTGQVVNNQTNLVTNCPTHKTQVSCYAEPALNRGGHACDPTNVAQWVGNTAAYGNNTAENPGQCRAYCTWSLQP